MQPDMPGDLDAYIDMTAEEIARLILSLMVEEALRERLAAFRPPDLQDKPLAQASWPAMVAPCEHPTNSASV